jgi:transcriptional regulator with PAS, ATPase and Fis domain
LDEIGDLPLALQAKLLRVLEDKEFYPLGAKKTVKVDVRILAATNQDLEGMIRERKFREDLFYRLNVIRLELPPLRERVQDVPLLINHFLKRSNLERGKSIQRFDPPALGLLLEYPYPGNIRELENIIAHACLICQGEIIQVEHLPLYVQTRMHCGEGPSAQALPPSADESTLIRETLSAHHWNRQATAQILHMDRTTLWRKMKRYNLKH